MWLLEELWNSYSYRSCDSHRYLVWFLRFVLNGLHVFSFSRIGLKDGQLKKFLDEARPLSPASRGRLLEEAMDLATVHHGIAQEGQTEVRILIIEHFDICLLCFRGSGTDWSWNSLPLRNQVMSRTCRPYHRKLSKHMSVLAVRLSQVRVSWNRLTKLRV